jgi:hypothetical protein
MIAVRRGLSRGTLGCGAAQYGGGNKYCLACSHDPPFDCLLQ